MKEETKWEDEFEELYGDMRNVPFSNMKLAVKNFIIKLLEESRKDMQVQFLYQIEKCVTAKSEDKKVLFMRVNAEEFEKTINLININK